MYMQEITPCSTSRISPRAAAACAALRRLLASFERQLTVCKTVALFFTIEPTAIMSRFVAAGSNDEPTAQDEAWAAAREKIDSVRQKKPEQGQVSSLYETLQANKGDSAQL